MGLLESLSLFTLMLVCAQTGKVMGLERMSGPASSASSSRKGSRSTATDCWVSLTSLASHLVQKKRYQSVGGSTGTVRMLNRPGGV